VTEKDGIEIRRYRDERAMSLEEMSRNLILRIYSKERKMKRITPYHET
jgi:hypothetical protein